MNCTVGCTSVKYLFVFLFLKNIDLLSLFVFNFIFGVLFIKNCKLDRIGRLLVRTLLRTVRVRFQTYGSSRTLSESSVMIFHRFMK